MSAKLGCLIMAAGNAARFGENKLLAEVEGKPLIAHALDAVPQELFDRIVVVTQYPQIVSLAHERGFQTIINDRPQEGIALTIRLGTQAMADCDGILYLVADQPLLSRESISRIVQAWKENPTFIVGAASGDRRGNPNLFPARFFPELTTLHGERGGSRIISKHEDAFLPVQLPARELFDCDTPQELQELKEHR